MDSATTVIGAGCLIAHLGDGRRVELNLLLTLRQDGSTWHGGVTEAGTGRVLAVDIPALAALVAALIAQP